MRFLVWAIVVMLIAGTVLIARGTEVPAVMLADHAAVGGPRITLADLLPGTATPTLRVRAARLDLGRAPQMGSARVLEREWLRERLSEFAVGVPPRIVVERKPPGDSGMDQVKRIVRHHLEARLGGTRAGDVLLPANPPHIAPDASLHVASEQWDPRAHGLQLRIACSTRRDCLPFFVTVQFAGTPTELREIAVRFAPLRQSAESSRSAAAPVVITPPRKKPSAVLTRPGMLAGMTVEARGIHISTQVICLDRGIEGQIIRVRNLESKRVLRAQVVGLGRVRGPV
jgi:hypothetical protein